MKKSIFFTLSLGIVSSLFFTSCDKSDKEPAVTMSGNYKGSFEGKFMGVDTLTSSGYDVEVLTVNDNKVKISGNNFETFEVLVTANGLNVEPVSQSDPTLLNFLYIGDEEKLKFTFNKDGNEADFIGIRE